MELNLTYAFDFQFDVKDFGKKYIDNLMLYMCQKVGKYYQLKESTYGADYLTIRVRLQKMKFAIYSTSIKRLTKDTAYAFDLTRFSMDYIEDKLTYIAFGFTYTQLGNYIIACIT